MRKLARDEPKEDAAPYEPVVGTGAKSRPPKPKMIVAAPDVSRCVLLKNCFDPAEETGDSWARELEDDVKHECESKYGKVFIPCSPPLWHLFIG
jgi:RNA-binding protein 23/39